MSLLYKVIFSSKSTSTHHKLALDALRHLQNLHAEKWRNLFLKYHGAYLEGAKAPDKTFYDFKNHVLHVQEDYWGGAVTAAEEWYGKLVQSLEAQIWKDVCYAAGVLSHYYCDPIQPLHTGQTEEEGKIHKVVEWGISKSYEELQNILVEDFGGYPEIKVPSGKTWLAQMVRKGAERSNPAYKLFIDHYDFELGVKNPASGLDQELKDQAAQLIGHAAIGLAHILDKAFAEAAVEPPEISLTLRGYLASLTIPIYWITRKMADRQERAIFQAMYEEVQQTGKVIEALPPDDKAVRQFHAQEVLNIPLDQLDAKKPRKTGTKHGHGKLARKRSKKAQITVTPPAKAGLTQRVARPSKRVPQKKPAVAEVEEPSKERALRFYLEKEDPIKDAPSIGPKTAERLRAAGIETVADLLGQEPDALAAKVDYRRITSETILLWQAQARLAYRIPQIRGHDVQILVHCEITDPQQLAQMEPAALLELVTPFVESAEGQRIIRSSKAPDLAEVTDWIAWAKQARE